MASAFNVGPVESMPMLSLIDGRVYVDSESTDAMPTDDLEVGSLPVATQLLRLRREHWHDLTPETPVPTRVVIEVDRDAPVAQVKRMVATVSAAGFEGVDFMVVKAYPEL